MRADFIEKERERIREIYRRRRVEISHDLYAPWQPAEALMVSERRRVAAEMLHKIGLFPKPGDKCLEIGYGRLGWLSDLLSWGLNERDLHGIEIEEERAMAAKKSLPTADLRVGDAAELPWETDLFNLVVVSTVFSSILNKAVREIIVKEIERVTAPGGVVVWYDLAVNNPRNSNVRGINAVELAQLFKGFQLTTRSVTLAPPIARFIAPRSFALATVLGSFSFLRTHLVGVMVKNSLSTDSTSH